MKKLLKIVAIHAGLAWYVYGVSKNLLANVRQTNAKRRGEDAGIVWTFVWKESYNNFRQAWREYKEGMN